MNDNERERPPLTPSADAGSGGDASDALEASRTRAERLLRAADDAIARALSSDSEQFLSETRQSGGE